MKKLRILLPALALALAGFGVAIAADQASEPKKEECCASCCCCKHHGEQGHACDHAAKGEKSEKGDKGCC
jgi:hypothetical protein